MTEIARCITEPADMPDSVRLLAEELRRLHKRVQDLEGENYTLRLQVQVKEWKPKHPPLVYDRIIGSNACGTRIRDLVTGNDLGPAD